MSDSLTKSMRARTRRAGILVSIIAVFLAVIPVLLAWNTIRSEQDRVLHEALATQLEQITNRLEVLVATRFALGEHVAHHVLAGGWVNQVEFLDEAQSVHDVFGDFQAINWVDRTGEIRLVTPYETNKGALGVNVRDNPIAKVAFERALETGSPQASPPLSLAQGGAGFVAYIPNTRKSDPSNFVNIVFRIEPLFDKVLQAIPRNDFRLRVTDGAMTVFDNSGSTAATGPTIVGSISIGNRIWTAELLPTAATRANFSSWLDEAVLGFGTLFPIVIGVLSHMVMQRQASLRENQARLSDFAECSSDWFWETDENDRFTMLHDRSGTSLPEELFIGNTRWEMAGKPEGLKKWQRYRETVQAREPIQGFEYSVAGRDRTVRINGVPFYDEYGDFRGYRGTGSDVTNRHQAEIALRNAKEEAEAASRIKSEFLATMSHEFRTPLNAIIGFSEMMRQELFGPLGAENYREYSDAIHESGTLMLALVNDVLDLSTIEAGKLSLSIVDVDLTETIEKSLRAFETTVANNAVTVETDIPDDLPVLHADERAITQIVMNLVSNAVKFTPNGGSVRIAVETESQNLRISVSDTGIGIDEKILPRITEPFTQAKGNAHMAQQGTGLGLSIVTALVAAHQGELAIESETGKGTKVIVSLPLDGDVERRPKARSNDAHAVGNQDNDAPSHEDRARAPELPFESAV